MSSPKKNVAYDLPPVGVVDSADTGIFKVNPTIAAGDFQVSIDFGALANLATLPVVAPAGSALIKIVLSQSEMNGDKIAIHCNDAAGGEWDDVIFSIEPTLVTVDDVVRSTTPANTLDVNISGEIDVDKIAGATQGVTPIGGKLLVDLASITDKADAATRLGLSAGQIIPGTVDTATFTPTVTQFEVDDITEATANHFNGRVVIWTSGPLAGQATDIAGYVLANSKGKFTVTAMTEAPLNNNKFVIV